MTDTFRRSYPDVVYENFTLMYKNIPLVDFSISENEEEELKNIEVLKVQNSELPLPYVLKCAIKRSPEEFRKDLSEFLKSRPAPDRPLLVAKCLNMTGRSAFYLNKMAFSHGISMQDCFWLCPKTEDRCRLIQDLLQEAKQNGVQIPAGKVRELFVKTKSALNWDCLNPRTNKLSSISWTSSAVIQLKVPTDLQSEKLDLSFVTPDINTNGSLIKKNEVVESRAKLWRLSEPGDGRSISDVYLTDVAKLFFEDTSQFVQYEPKLLKLSGQIRIASICDYSSTEDRGFIPAAHVLHAHYPEVYELAEQGLPLVRCLNYFRKRTPNFFNDVLEICKKELSTDDYEKFEDMIVFDSLIFNFDRHLQNWGFFIDNDKQKLISLAPVFDNELSIFVLISQTKRKDDESLNDYAQRIEQTQSNRTHGGNYQVSFDQELQAFVQHRHSEALERLQNFSFKQLNVEGLDKISDEQLEVASKILQIRCAKARKMLKEKLIVEHNQQSVEQHSHQSLHVVENEAQKFLASALEQASDLEKPLKKKPISLS